MVIIGVLRDLGGGGVEEVSGHEVKVGVERGDGVGVYEERSVFWDVPGYVCVFPLPPSFAKAKVSPSC